MAEISPNLVTLQLVGMDIHNYDGLTASTSAFHQLLFRKYFKIKSVLSSILEVSGREDKVLLSVEAAFVASVEVTSVSALRAFGIVIGIAYCRRIGDQSVLLRGPWSGDFNVPRNSNQNGTGSPDEVQSSPEVSASMLKTVFWINFNSLCINPKVFAPKNKLCW